MLIRSKYLFKFVSPQTYNLGTGKGYSVFQMVKAVEKASGRKVSGSGRPGERAEHHCFVSTVELVALFLQVSYKIAPRRDGDVASCYADPRLAETELAWKAEFDLERMCKGDNMGSSALRSAKSEPRMETPETLHATSHNCVLHLRR